MFQACRGGKIDVGLSRMQMTDSNPGQSSGNDPTWTDMLIANSTIPGYASMRDNKYGSWFIEALVLVFMNEACRTDLYSMLSNNVTSVMNEDHHENKQSIEIITRGRFKSLFF